MNRKLRFDPSESYDLENSTSSTNRITPSAPVMSRGSKKESPRSMSNRENFKPDVVFEGDSVEYYSPEVQKWLNATVIRKRDDDNVDIRLNNGDKVYSVESSLIRLSSSPKSAAKQIVFPAVKRNDTPYRPSQSRPPLDQEENEFSFEIGERVYSKYKGKNKSYPGTILNRTKDKQNFHIKYDDGEEEFPVNIKSLTKEKPLGNIT